MRIATYNVEWFTNLFDRNNRLFNDNKWSGRQDVTRSQQTEALAIVFTALDADAVMVIEAPDSSKNKSSVAALEHFAQTFDLRTSKALSGFSNTTQQEISLLYDPAKMKCRHDPQGTQRDGISTPQVPAFDTEFRLDLNTDGRMENIQFSKPPLEVELTPNGGPPIRLIGVHVKSKAPHGAKNLNEQIRISIANRRKQLAQCIWLRRRVDSHLQDGEPVIVLGDFNDGPGLDEYEKLFGQSGVEIVMGCEKEPGEVLFDPHAMAAMSPRPGSLHSTSRFLIQPENRYLNALLDFIMVSQDLRAKGPNWQIWHPFDNPDCFAAPELRAALLTASDHFPVTIDIEL